MKGKRFRRAVEAEVERLEMVRQLAEPIRFRNLTVDFEARTVDFDGRKVVVGSDARCFVIPLLMTERPIFTRGGVL